MNEWKQRLSELLSRAGLNDVPPRVLIAASVICLLALGYAGFRWWPDEQAVEVASSFESATPGQPESVDPQGALGQPAKGGGAGTPERPSTQPSETVFVHVAGEVEHPDVYELKAGSRAAAAIQAAGGLTPDANGAAVNLARVVTDGEQILVPNKEDPQQQPQSSASAPGCVKSEGGPVNINTADATELDKLPGVGPSTADKIIAEREANGPFKNPDDLGRVSGIGPKRLETLKPLVCVQ